MEELTSRYRVPPRREIHVLLRHAEKPAEDAALALAREERPASPWYADYQHALAAVLDIQAGRGDYDQVMVRGDRSILPIQRELRDGLRTHELPVDSLPHPSPERLWVLAGLSECGKSTVGELLRAEHGTTRLKIGYLLEVAAARAGVDDPYTYWDEHAQAEALTEELLRFCALNPGTTRVSVESAHRYAATRHLQRIWGERCQVIYLDAPPAARITRSADDRDRIQSRDQIKRNRGADRISAIADWSIDNTGTLAELKFAVHRLASAAKTGRPLAAPPDKEGFGPPWVRRWLTRAVRHLVDPHVAAVLATGSTGQTSWCPGWSDLDLLVVRDDLPGSWVRDTAGTLSAPDGVKVGLSLFTSVEVAAGHVPPRLVHALDLAGRTGQGVLYLRGDFTFPDFGPSGDDRAARGELPLVAMTLRRLLAQRSVDVRTVYKHVTLMMKIILRAEGIAAEASDDVLAAFTGAHPETRVFLPALSHVAGRNWRADDRLTDRVFAAADAILHHHQSLVRGDALTRPEEETR